MKQSNVLIALFLFSLVGYFAYNSYINIEKNNSKIPLEVIDYDIVIINTGEEYRGKITNQNDTSITIKPVVIGSINVNYTFGYDEISNITYGRENIEKTLDNPLLTGYYEVEQFREYIEKLYSDNNFVQLEKEAISFRKNKTRFLSGQWKIHVLYYTLKDEYNYLSIEEITKNIQKLKTWKQEFPKSITPVVLLINAYKDLAWKHRGGSYSKGVSRKGWNEYKNNFSLAQGLIDSVDDSFDIDPHFYVSAITVSIGSGTFIKEFPELLRKTMTYDKDYYQLYTTAIPFLLPRWYGNKQDVIDFANFSAEKTEGDELYSRTANTIYGYVGKEKYGSYAFDWKRIKSGFEDIMKKYPSNFYHINAYARMACYYGDYKTVKKLTDKLGYLWVSRSKDVWGSFAEYYECKSVADSNAIITNTDIKDLDINGKNARGETHLYYTIKYGLYDYSLALINAGADVRIPNKHGVEPIHKAADKGLIKLVSILLDKGVPVDTKTDNGWTPLHYASAKGLAGMTKLLLQKGADVNAETKNGKWNSLQYAARYGHMKVFKLLLQQKGIDVNLQNGFKKSVLHIAVSQGNEIMVMMLLSMPDINVNITDRYQNTPLSLAKKDNYLKIATLLISKGAKDNPNAITEKQRRQALDLLKKGVKEQNKGNYQEAKKFYLESRRLNPYNNEVHYDIALINQFERNFTTCLENIKKALAIKENDARSILSGGQCLFMLNRREEMLSYYRRYIKLEPNNFRTKELLQKYPELRNPTR